MQRIILLNCSIEKEGWWSWTFCLSVCLSYFWAPLLRYDSRRRYQQAIESTPVERESPAKTFVLVLVWKWCQWQIAKSFSWCKTLPGGRCLYNFKSLPFEGYTLHSVFKFFKLSIILPEWRLEILRLKYSRSRQCSRNSKMDNNYTAVKVHLWRGIPPLDGCWLYQKLYFEVQRTMYTVHVFGVDYIDFCYLRLILRVIFRVIRSI